MCKACQVDPGFVHGLYELNHAVKEVGLQCLKTPSLTVTCKMLQLHLAQEMFWIRVQGGNHAGRHVCVSVR